MVVHAYYPLGEVRVEREARALLQAGYEVDVICLQDKGDPPTDFIDGIQIYRLPVKRHRGKGIRVQMLEYISFFVLAFIKLTGLHFRKRYSSVQVHNLPDFLVFTALVPRLTGAAVLLDLHDLMPEFFAANNDSGMDALPVRLLKFQEKMACAFASHVITVTELWKETLARRSAPASKISVVMNVADPGIFDRTVLPDRSNSSNGHFNIIYHGTITYRYGPDILLRAIDLLRNDIPSIHATIHGRGEFLEELKQLAQTLDLGSHVSFSDQYVPTSELSKMILGSDVGVVPYRRNVFTDGILPTKLMECVALGVPVIASRTPVIQVYFDDSMVQYFSPGEVEELANEILELYKDRARLGQIAENAERFNQKYNWASIASDYVALVNRLNTKDRDF